MCVEKSVSARKGKDTRKVRGSLPYHDIFQCLVPLPIFALFFILQHIEVGSIAALTDVMLLHSFTHGTVGFCAMSAVAILALVGETEDFREVVSYLLYLHVEGTKALDTWSVDDVASAWNLVHLREGRGMHTLVVC